MSTWIVIIDECFFVVRSQILFMDPLPTVNRVFSMVVQQERQLSVVPPSSAEPNSFINASNGFGKGRGVFGSSSTNKNASNKKCSYCHLTWHTIDVYWGKTTIHRVILATLASYGSTTMNPLLLPITLLQLTQWRDQLLLQALLLWPKPNINL